MNPHFRVDMTEERPSSTTPTTSPVRLPLSDTENNGELPSYSEVVETRERPSSTTPTNSVVRLPDTENGELPSYSEVVEGLPSNGQASSCVISKMDQIRT